MEAKVSVERAVLSSFCRELGLDPTAVKQVILYPDLVEVTLYERDKAGQPTVDDHLQPITTLKVIPVI